VVAGLGPGRIWVRGPPDSGLGTAASSLTNPASKSPLGRYCGHNARRSINKCYTTSDGRSCSARGRGEHVEQIKHSLEYNECSLTWLNELGSTASQPVRHILPCLQFTHNPRRMHALGIIFSAIRCPGILFLRSSRDLCFNFHGF